VRDYLRLSLGARPHEVFVAMFVDAENRLLGCEELFRRTLTQTSVYPSEVVKTALRYNAAGVIFAHNHPSGVLEPSRADEPLTQTLKQRCRWSKSRRLTTLSWLVRRPFRSRSGLL
jgi:DNA repair protein RadC